jgi:hypothetical protein
VKGPSFKTCGGNRNGVWSQKNKIPKCVDVTAPNITCPDDYTIELDGNKSYVLLKSFEPLKFLEGDEFSQLRF